MTVTGKGFPEDKTTRHVHLYWSAKRMLEDRLQLETELDLMTGLSTVAVDK